MREKPYRHPQSKKLTMLGIFDDPRYASCMSIWCSYVGGPSAVPIRWAVFFRNNTHTHFGMFVLWSFFEVNGSRFWKGSLDGCPQLFSTFISQSLGAQTIFAQLFLRIFPPVSCGWVVCMLARLSFAFVHQFFFEGLLNFLLALFSVRNCVLNLSPNICGSLFCSLQKVSRTSGAFFETHPEMFFGRFPQLSFTQSEINLNLSQYFLEGSRNVFLEGSINRGQCIIAERAYSKKTIHPYTSTLQKINHGILWTYFRSPISSSIWFHLISVPGRQNRSGCPTSLGAWWPVTPGKASATRVVQKWIGAPDPRWNWRKPHLSNLYRAWSLEAVGSKVGLRGLSWEHSRNGLRQVHAAQAVAGSSCQDGKHIFIDLSHGSLPPWQLSSCSRWVGATILKMPRRTWMTCGTA